MVDNIGSFNGVMKIYCRMKALLFLQIGSLYPLRGYGDIVGWRCVNTYIYIYIYIYIHNYPYV